MQPRAWRGSKAIRNAVRQSSVSMRFEMAQPTILREYPLTVVTIITDPVYLTEPLVRTTDFELDPHQQMQAMPCDPIVEITDRPKGAVPHYLPGRNPNLK